MMAPGFGGWSVQARSNWELERASALAWKSWKTRPKNISKFGKKANSLLWRWGEGKSSLQKSMQLHCLLLVPPRTEVSGTLGNTLPCLRLSRPLGTLKKTQTDFQDKHEYLVGQAETLSYSKRRLSCSFLLQEKDSAQVKIYQDSKILSYILISTCMQVTAKYLLRKSDRNIP